MRIRGITISGLRMPIDPSSSFFKIRLLSFSSTLKFPTPSLFLPSYGHGRLLSTIFQSSTSPLLSELQNDDSFPSAVGDVKIETRKNDSKVILKGMKYSELQKWLQSHGYRPAQALMLWKRLYGNNIWANGCADLEGLNKNLKTFLGEHAEFQTLTLKDTLMASDGTKKVVTLFR